MFEVKVMVFYEFYYNNFENICVLEGYFNMQNDYVYL